MFLFYRLLLAHMIADFPLQFNKLFRLRLEGIRGSILHGCVFGIFAIIMSYPYITFSFIGAYLIFIWVFHILIDWLKIKLMLRFRTDNILMFLADQVLHLLSLAVVIPFNFKPASPISIIDKFYSHDKLIIGAILYILATFAGSVIIYYLKRDFLDKGTTFPSLERNLDIIERSAVFALIVMPGKFYLIIPFIFAAKALICWMKKFKYEKFDFTIFNLVASYSIAIICGFILRMIKL